MAVGGGGIPPGGGPVALCVLGPQAPDLSPNLYASDSSGSGYAVARTVVSQAEAADICEVARWRDR